MPKYMYADSTEFPLQRDFIDLLERYADMAIEAMPNQQQILELKKRISTDETQKKAKLSQIDIYRKELLSSIDTVTSKLGREDFAKVSDGMKAAANQQVDEFRKSEEKRYQEQIKALKAELSKRQSTLLQVLGEFLYHDPLEVSEIQILATLKGKSYTSQVKVTCSIGASYSFTLDFAARQLKVEDLTEKTIQVPAVMKPVMLSKEKKPHFIEINDWALSQAEYTSNTETLLQATFQKDPGNSESPRLEMELEPGENRINRLNYVDDENNRTDILKEDQLRKHIDDNLEEFSKYLLGYFFGLLSKKKRTTSTEIGGKSVTDEDLTEEFVTRAAEEYGTVVIPIRERGLVKNELNLKTEDLEGKRTEIYLKIDEYKTKMGAIPQGAQICSSLGLD
jgi:hypothetical protein